MICLSNMIKNICNHFNYHFNYHFPNKFYSLSIYSNFNFNL